MCARMATLVASAAAGEREHTVMRNCVRLAGSTSRRASTSTLSWPASATPDAATRLFGLGSSPSAMPRRSPLKMVLTASRSMGGTPLTICATLLGAACISFQGVKKSPGDKMGIGVMNLVTGTGSVTSVLTAPTSLQVYLMHTLGGSTYGAWSATSMVVCSCCRGCNVSGTGCIREATPATSATLSFACVSALVCLLPRKTCRRARLRWKLIFTPTCM
mmetsp:Transcript_10437/g.43155  ORF Transcript_10437/g.43155 Transcript_10437/m.43155 type:complete len:218 (+) Transcript_10437:356-1009(+)